MKEIKNAVIESTMLGCEDHGIMTCFLYLDYGGSGQGFGGYGLDEPIKDKDGKYLRRQGSAYGMEFIRRILEVLEIDKWEQLKGEHLRVEADYGHVYKIGHILKDKWFEPKKDLSYFFNEEDK